MNDETKKPWEKVTNPSYFKQVMRNMAQLGFGPRKPEIAHARFGITGGGHSPNYQIESPDGAKHCFWGMRHEEALGAGDEFEPKNLSVEQFTYKDVEGMLARLL